MAYTKTNWVNNNEPAINADNLNHLEDGIEKAYGVELLAVVDTAPSECSVGDKYFNTTTNKIYEATATDTWDTEGYDAESGVFYVVFSDQAIYTYNGTTLVGVGSSGGSTEISISTTQPSGDEVLWINPDEVPTGQGSYISNEYGSSQEIGYSQEYSNEHFGGDILYSNSTGTTGDVTLNSNLSNYSYIEIYGYHNIFNDSVYTKVDLSLNKNINVSTITTNEEQHRLITQTYTKGTNKLTRVYAFRTTILDKQIAEEGSVNGEISITKVIGYK